MGTPLRHTLSTCVLRARMRVDAVDVSHATRRRLAELGIRPGARVEVMSRTAGGGRVVSVSEARIALDRATADAVAVTAESDPEVEATPAVAPAGQEGTAWA